MKKLLFSMLVAGSLVSAHANLFTYDVLLSGPGESPANASPGTGVGFVSYDNVTHLMSVNVTFSGLTGTVTASHIHAATVTPFSGTAGVATPTPTFPGFPSGVTSGSYASTFDMSLSSSYNGAFITANGGTAATAETALFNAMQSGRAYWNIHTSTFGGGEIRGFLVVPEPSTFSLAGIGAVGMAVRAWKRKDKSSQS